MIRTTRYPAAGLPVKTILCVLALALAIVAGCHTARVATRTATAPAPPARETTAPATAASGDSARATEDTVLEKIRSGGIRYSSFSARAKLDVHSVKGDQNGINVFLRMQKDSCIWISIRPVLGIELVRVMVTPDSVKMINFFKKTVTARSADSLQQLLHIPYDFATLQDLLIGNPVMLGDSISDFKTDTTGAVSFGSMQGPLRSDYVFSPDFSLRENDLTMEDTAGVQRASREAFDEYKVQDGRDFSFRRSVLLETGTETTALIRFSHVSFDDALSFPFPEVAGFQRN